MENGPSCFRIHILNQEASLKKPLFNFLFDVKSKLV